MGSKYHEKWMKNWSKHHEKWIKNLPYLCVAPDTTSHHQGVPFVRNPVGFHIISSQEKLRYSHLGTMFCETWKSKSFEYKDAEFAFSGYKSYLVFVACCDKGGVARGRGERNINI